VGSALDKGIMITNYTSESSASYRKTFLLTDSSSFKPYLSYTYTTSIPVSQVCVNPSSTTMNVNESRNINTYVSILPSNATNKGFYWVENSTSSIATITSGGLVCAKSPGTVTFTVRSSENSSKYAYCVVKIQKKAIIIVPGIMGTELKLRTSANVFTANTQLWPPNDHNETDTEM